jgi:hypothetical protein
MHAGSILTASPEAKARIEPFQSRKRQRLDQCIRVRNLFHAVEKCFDDPGADTLALICRNDHDVGEVEMKSPVADDAADANEIATRNSANTAKGVSEANGDRRFGVRLETDSRSDGGKLRDRWLAMDNLDGHNAGRLGYGFVVT